MQSLEIPWKVILLYYISRPNRDLCSTSVSYTLIYTRLFGQTNLQLFKPTFS